MSLTTKALGVKIINWLEREVIAVWYRKLPRNESRSY